MRENKEILEDLIIAAHSDAKQKVKMNFFILKFIVIEIKKMLLQPQKPKFRKQHKGRIHGNAYSGAKLNFGSFGLKAMQPGRITARQIEAARRAITREMKREGRVWIRIFPDVPVTKKPVEVRMGKGKGSVEYWVSRINPGRILFEVDGVPESIAREALYKASAKLPIKCKFIKRI